MNMKTTSTGFLVVLEIPEGRGETGMRLNPHYAGVDRVPAYPSDYPEESFALDQYVFGGIKSKDTNVIPDFDKAVELLKRLSSSPRSFEIILCAVGPSDPALTAFKPEKLVELGYDVAVVKGDYWSIVDDCAPGEWVKPFLESLNESGLFRDRSTAEEYLRAYRQNREPDADMPFEIVYVARIVGGEKGVGGEEKGEEKTAM